jgi:glycosyltransferase involved in cell wall biosynthesis/GT2 family glycosyltransferase
VVLFTSYSGALGGAERLLIGWATALELEVCLACPDGPLADAARARGLRVLPLRRRGLDLRASLTDRVLSASRLAGHAHELRRLVVTLDPELVVAWGMRSALACLLGPAWSGRLGSASGRPAVAFHHNDFLPGRTIGRLVRIAAARADIVTVPSRAVARDLDPAGRLADRLEVVHPGVDVERFDATSPPAQPPEVVMLGALVAWKRADLALDACALARRRHPELRLRLVGAPLDDAADRVTAALRARAAEPDLAGAVEFVGEVGDPAPELARAACLLHCAEREPFGIAVLEALAAGRPVVVPASSGPAEIVDDSCAFVYPPGDAAAAAAALTRLLSDPELAGRMGAAGRLRARERFDETEARWRWARAIARVRVAGSVTAPAGLQIVTVTHNSGSVIGGLLGSVERHLPGVSVVVVDCASSDQTVAIAGRSRAARVVALEQNVGFGQACNRGIAVVGEPVTALLNPDVELLDDSLLSLGAAALRRGRDEQLLAPLVLSGDGSRQDSVHPVPGSPAELVRAILPFTRLPAGVAAPLAPWQARAPRRVGWAVGCALVARTETLRRLGPFDERIFLYGEDLELGLRAADAGIETWFWPSARVLHHGAHASRAAFDGEPFELLARGRREVVAGRLGPRRAAVDDATQALTFASRIVAKRALGHSAARERRQLAALLDARRARR